MTELNWRNLAPRNTRTERICVSLGEAGRTGPGHTSNRKRPDQMIWFRHISIWPASVSGVLPVGIYLYDKNGLNF